MLYGEFIEGTGCRDNAHNYQVYKDLEVMYMNSDMTKDKIYEYGKKLVDNSKSEEELRVEAEVKAQIEEHKDRIATLRGWIKQNKEMLAYWKNQRDKEMVAFYRNPIKNWKEEIRHHRNQITALEWILR